jgi:hypothetical protein
VAEQPPSVGAQLPRGLDPGGSIVYCAEAPICQPRTGGGPAGTLAASVTGGRESSDGAPGEGPPIIVVVSGHRPLSNWTPIFVGVQFLEHRRIGSID